MKKYRYFLVLMIGCVLCLMPMNAQNTDASSKTYTLEQCLNEAVNNNKKLRNADNKVSISSEQRKDAFTKYFPTVTANGAGFISDKALLQLSLGQMGLSYAKNGVVAGVTAMQPVFAGGQIVNGNKLAKVGEQSAKLQRDMAEDEVRLATEQYYWQMVMLKEKLVTLDQLDKQLESLCRDAQVAVDAGVRNRNDLLQVKLRKNEVRTTRIQVENSLGTVSDLLAQIIGHPQEKIDVNYKILSASGAMGNVMPDNPEKLYQSPESSLVMTKEYQLLDKQIEADRLAYKMAVGKNLPSVAVGGGYVYNNVMDKSQNNFVGMVTVSVPISGWWGGSHDMKRRKIELQNATNDKSEQSEMLMIRMRKSWNDMNDAYRQVGIAQESIDASAENLRLNTDYYQAGTATITDLLDAQTLYQQSRDKYVESYTNYEVKKRQYLQATGR